MSHPSPGVLSHWHILCEDFSTSTQSFYAAVEAAIHRRNLPEVELSRVLFNEGGFGTAKREYLRISRRRVAFDLCSAPYGNGHFFSWWLARAPAKYGLILLVFLFIALPLWALFALALWYALGAIPSLTFVVVSVPMVPLLAGLGVEHGLIGEEEWVLAIPVVGQLYTLVFTPTTYYRLDTAYMFRDSVRSAVKEVLNELRAEQGLRLLGEDELRPDEPEEAAG